MRGEVPDRRRRAQFRRTTALPPQRAGHPAARCRWPSGYRRL